MLLKFSFWRAFLWYLKHRKWSYKYQKREELSRSGWNLKRTCVSSEIWGPSALYNDIIERERKKTSLENSIYKPKTVGGNWVQRCMLGTWGRRIHHLPDLRPSPQGTDFSWYHMVTGTTLGCEMCPSGWTEVHFICHVTPSNLWTCTSNPGKGKLSYPCHFVKTKLPQLSTKWYPCNSPDTELLFVNKPLSSV